MSEQPFDMRKAGAAGAAVILGAGIVAGAVGQNMHNAEVTQEHHDAATASTEAEAAYHNDVEAAVNAAYDRAAIVGEINVVAGTSLIAAAEDILKTQLGEEVYSNNRGRLYDLLQDSAQIYTSLGDPQPGSTMYVVEVNFDHDETNGDEYIVTDGSGGIIDPPTDGPIPSPITT